MINESEVLEMYRISITIASIVLQYYYTRFWKHYYYYYYY